MWFFAGVGAIVAGLLLLLRDGLPLLKARRTGVIRTKGTRPQPIERATDPDRFDALVASRQKGLLVPFAVMVGGVLFLAVQIGGLMMGA